MADQAGDTERPTFADWIAKHARGTLNEEATMALADAVKVVADGNKKATVTITLSIAPSGAKGRTVMVGGRVSVKTPPPDPELAVFYADEAGTLHRDDPYQSRIPGVVPGAVADDEATEGAGNE